MSTYTTNAFGMPVKTESLDTSIREMAKKLAVSSTLFSCLQERAKEGGECLIPQVSKTFMEAARLMLNVLEDPNSVDDQNVLWHFLTELDKALDLMFPGSEEKEGVAIVTKEWLEALAPDIDQTEVTWMMMHHFLELIVQNTQLNFSLDTDPSRVTPDALTLAQVTQHATMWLSGRIVPSDTLTEDFLQLLSMSVGNLERAGCEVDFSLSIVR